ncbi:hypothetical protein [Mesorhizobium sp. RIZ17]|uniref:hypothetical protein n=1 Tax=Mesorhizobium sp. RIZ17 TaxID=3132743 RepID=UPI003DA8107A
MFGPTSAGTLIGATPFDEIMIEQWRAAFDGPFMSAMDIVRAVLPSMREKKWSRVCCS